MTAAVGTILEIYLVTDNFTQIGVQIVRKILWGFMHVVRLIVVVKLSWSIICKDLLIWKDWFFNFNYTQQLHWCFSVVVVI